MRCIVYIQSLVFDQRCSSTVLTFVNDGGSVRCGCGDCVEH